MNRRKLLKLVTMATGSALVGGNLVLNGCARGGLPENLGFSEQDLALLNEIAEIIIPRTDTPGAKDAEVGKFMAATVNDCYYQDDQDTFHEGLAKINEISREHFNTNFINAKQDHRIGLLAELEIEAREYEKPEGGTEHYFTMMKQLTLMGYFTSQAGATESLRHNPVPGRYDGCHPYEEGDPAWA
ncbi:MAG: gluconate 2-dehydrogenase subunit 3 family protein [Balneolales bacterium]